MERIREVDGAGVEEVFDPDQDSFNEFIADKDLVYLPGSSAPRPAPPVAAFLRMQRKAGAELPPCPSALQLSFGSGGKSPTCRQQGRDSQTRSQTARPEGMPDG
ncbi:MAG: hypothetical protein ACRDZ4_03580 [Egibacteraceae bacterium]